jgi:hypothetical protein
MKSSIGKTFAGRSIYALLISALVTVTAFGQHLVITGAPTLGGTGTYNIKGNITNTVAIAINPTVTMSGAAAQTIGTTGAITLTTLNVNTTGATPTTTMNVAVDVNTGLSVAAASTFVVGANQLNLSGTSTLNVTGLLTTVAGSTVVYDQTGGGQAVLGGFTYNGALTLSGTSLKNFGGDVTVAATGVFNHSGGNLTIDNNLTIASTTTAPIFATITNVSANKTLALSGTGGKSITTVTTTTALGAISNTGPSGLLTIGTLSGNNGSISGGAGGVTFTLGATNAGTITGGAGAVTFSSTLAHSAGTITAGSGGVAFGGVVTTTGGSIASSAVGNLLSFNQNLTNTGGTIDLTLTGAAKFSGLTAANTAGLNFAATSNVTYDGASGQTIADVSYGNLTMKTGTKTWTLGAIRTINGTLDIQAGAATTVNGNFNLTVLGNITLANNLTKSLAAVLFTNIGSSVSGTGFEIIGSVTRTISALQSYTFNNASMIVTPTVVGTLSSFTISSLPSTNPTGYVAGNSVNRKYTSSYVGAGFTATVQLAYLGAEYTGSNASNLKDFQNGIAKANKLGGTYTRGGPTNGFMYVSLPALTNAVLISGQELGIDDRFNMFNSIASTSWALTTTWDAGAIPSINDDVFIINTHAVTILDGTIANALSVTIDGTTANTLTVGGGASGILNVGVGGLTNNATLGVLIVSPAANVTITGGNLAAGGNITNNGTVTVQ